MLKGKILSNKQLYRLFLSYFSITILCVFISVIWYSVSAHIVKEQLESKMHLSIRYTKDFFDDNLLEVEKATYNILESTNVKTLSNNNLKNSYSDKRKQYEAISKSIASIDLKTVKQFFVVFNEFDLTLSAGGNASKHELYVTQFAKYYNSFEDWQNALNLKDGYSQCSILTDENGNKTICYIHRTPLLSNQRQKATAVVFIDVASLIKEKLYFTESTEFDYFITNQNDEIIFSSSSGENLDTYLRDNHYITESIPSQFMNWKYTVILSKNNVYFKLRFFNIIALTCCLLFLFMGVVISYLLSKKQYLPIKGFLSVFIDDDSMDFKEAFSSIEKKITSILNKNTKLEKDLTNQMSTLQEYYLKNLLLTQPSKNTSKIEPIHFNKKNFTLILFKVNDAGILADEDDSTINFAISNVFGELIESLGQSYFFVFENEYICILNSNKQDLELELCSKAEFTKDFLFSNFSAQIVPAVSNTVFSEKDLPTIYKQALNIIAEDGSYGSNEQSLVNYSTDEITSKYTKESEQRLLVYLKHGDSKSALHFLNGIFAETYTKEESNYSLQLFMFYDVLGTLMKFSSSIGESKQFFLNFSELIASNDLTRIKTVLFDWVEEVCALSKSSENLFDAKTEQIINLIHEEYNNPNLNVSYIANKLDVTINYLSSYFKSKTGQLLSEYILSYRLNKACELIEKEVSVTETYRICGFSDINTFIRAFKKKYGTTPGKLKK